MAGDRPASLEEQPGYSPFTTAIEIAALLIAADMADVRVDAARVGARRVDQAVPIASSRGDLRSAASDRSAVPRRQLSPVIADAR
jgi:hypothetical protein